MVNASKHKINPFVGFLKNITEKNQLETLYYDSKAKTGNEIEDSVIIFVDEKRAIRVYEGVIKFSNKCYFSVGGILTTIKSLYSNSGSIELIIRTGLDFDYFSIHYSNKEELYDIISEFDSSKDGTEYKNKLINKIETAGIPEEEAEGIYRIL